MELSAANLFAILLSTVLALVISHDPVAPGRPLSRRYPPVPGQVLGVRRIQFTRHPPTPTMPTSAGGGIGDSPFHRGGSSGVTDDPSHAGSADSESDVSDGQSHEDRHLEYRRMLIQREQEKLLERLPTAIVEPHGQPLGNNNNNNNGGTNNDTDSARNCTEYTVTEGTVRICGEVRVMNATDISSTTTRRVMTAAEAEMEARRASMSRPIGGGEMNGRDWIVRERYKQARLFMIQAMILQKLGFRRQPHVSDLDLSDNERSRIMDAFRLYESEMGGEQFDEEGRYMKSISLLTPSCDLPRNTNRVWRDGSRFRLYFQIQPPAWQETKISSASLRLYKRSIQNCDCYFRRQEHPEPLLERLGRRRRQKRMQDEDIPLYRPPVEQLSFDDVTEAPQEEQLELTEDTVKVTVYAYTKSVKVRRKEKVQELASVVVRRDYEGWIKLDIKSAVADWYHGVQRNFGLLVRVHDHLQREMYPFSVLTPTNCTLNSNFSLPFPLAVGDTSEERFNGTDKEGNQTTPYLDLVTLGSPRYNAVIRHRRNAAILTALRPQKPSKSSRRQPFRRANLSTLLQWLSEKIMQSKFRVAMYRKKRSIRQ